MRYVPYDELDGRPNLILDGSPTRGTVLTVTHWPGYPPPEAVAADLSAQMAIRLNDHPELVDGIELVSNNHFDQDGLVSIFAVTRPDEALPRRAFLEDVAGAGDFGTYRDRNAARVSMVLSAYADGRGEMELPADYGEQTAVLYGVMLERLASICDDVDAHRELWADEDATLTASEAAIESGTVTIEEFADVDLAVVDVPTGGPSGGGHRFGGTWLDGLHPMAVNNATNCLVVATVRRRSYTIEQRYESWVQLRSRPLRLRRDLAPFVRRLQDAERGDAVWSATAVSGLTPIASSGGGDSTIERAQFVELLIEHLRTAPPAWDPYVATA